MGLLQRQYWRIVFVLWKWKVNIYSEASFVDGGCNLLWYVKGIFGSMQQGHINTTQHLDVPRPSETRDPFSLLDTPLRNA